MIKQLKITKFTQGFKNFAKGNNISSKLQKQRPNRFDKYVCRQSVKIDIVGKVLNVICCCSW